MLLALLSLPLLLLLFVNVVVVIVCHAVGRISCYHVVGGCMGCCRLPCCRLYGMSSSTNLQVVKNK